MFYLIHWTASILQCVISHHVQNNWDYFNFAHAMGETLLLTRLTTRHSLVIVQWGGQLQLPWAKRCVSKCTVLLDNWFYCQPSLSEEHAANAYACRSETQLAKARPTMSYIRLVMNMHIMLGVVQLVYSTCVCLCWPLGNSLGLVQLLC